MLPMAKLTRRERQAGKAKTEIDYYKLQTAQLKAQLAELNPEKVRVQMAGISVAASGYGHTLQRTDFGWSVPYEDVLRLFQNYDALRRRVAHLEAGVDPNHMKHLLTWNVNGKTMGLEFEHLADAERHQQDIEGYLPDQTKIETISHPGPVREGPFEVLPIPTAMDRLLQEET